MAERMLRQGLPRVVGGAPWPSADGATANVASAPGADALASVAETDADRAADIADTAVAHPAPIDAAGAVDASAAEASIRRGLPHTVGGEAWPPVETVARPVDGAVADGETVRVLAPDDEAPLSFRRTAWRGVATDHVRASDSGSGLTWTRGVAALFGAAGFAVLAGAVVAAVRLLLSLPVMQDFVSAFPGEYASPLHVEPGFAPWVGWQHFFNVFLMVLIIRSGLRIRGEKRPTAFWIPRKNRKGKMSLTMWFHQSLDLLWIINGAIFIVLLFATDHWVRIVPTSWEVFPNALSAALQYVSFDWPHENSWNNYNSLQQLAYFTTVFVAAPLAIVSGFRLSALWPKKSQRLAKAFPLDWARAVHFPVMLYFVVFIVAHVALVVLTGFLRNLNYLYASSEVVGWTGFWVFVASLVVIALGWTAARPSIIAPIAGLFGNVSSR